jgi:hypothetical protein
LVHIFPCSRIGRPILEIYKSLTDIYFHWPFISSVLHVHYLYFPPSLNKNITSKITFLSNIAKRRVYFKPKLLYLHLKGTNKRVGS